MSSDTKNVVTMAHGSGGLAMQQLIEELFYRRSLTKHSMNVKIKLVSLLPK